MARFLVATVPLTGQVDLKTGTPTSDEVRDAVKNVLGEPSFRVRVRTIAAEMSQYDAATRGAELIEQMLARLPRSQAS